MYIKVLIEEVNNGNVQILVDEEIEAICQGFGLNIVQGDDIGHMLPYYDFEEYRYLLLCPMDSKDGNKCRHIRQSDEEKEVLLNLVITRGFETVESLPVQEII